MKSVLLRLDDRLAERLELMNRVLGGAGTRGGKKAAIVRCALAQVLPDEEQLKEIIQYNRAPRYKRDKMSEPEEPNFVFEAKKWI